MMPARAGQILDLQPTDTPSSPKQHSVVRTGDVQTRHFVYAPWGRNPAQGEIALHCLVGPIQIIAHGDVQELVGDQLL